MTLWYLFIEFVQIGLFAVGGGMATVPFLLNLADKYDWYTVAEFADMVAVSQSTPGPLGINMATYGGYNAAGFIGSLVATFGLVLPALVIIMIIAGFMDNFSEHKIVKAVFLGIRPIVAALVLYAVWELCVLSLFEVNSLGNMIPNLTSIFICFCFFAVMQVKKFKKIHPIVWIFLGGIVGIVLQLGGV